MVTCFLPAKKLTRTGTFADLRDVLTWGNAPEVEQVECKKLAGKGLDSLKRLPYLLQPYICNSNGAVDGGSIPTYRLFAGE